MTYRDWRQCEVRRSLSVDMIPPGGPTLRALRGPSRHDNDRKRPRTTAEIYSLNRVMAKKMEDVFGRRGIPVVPSIGMSHVQAGPWAPLNDPWLLGATLPQAIMMCGVGGHTSLLLMDADAGFH